MLPGASTPGQLPPFWWLVPFPARDAGDTRSPPSRPDFPARTAVVVKIRTLTRWVALLKRNRCGIILGALCLFVLTDPLVVGCLL